MRTALIVAGHGSHISPNTAAVVWQHVDRLRVLGVADEIAAAFWKEMPSFAAVMNTLTADDVTIVPLFTAHGYFTQTVIPAEMQLAGSLTTHKERLIRYTPSLHMHPYLTEMVQTRIEQTMRDFALDRDTTAVAIIGHSTRRNPDSRQATERQVTHIRNAQIATEVEAVYLDDKPEISEIYTLTKAPNLIAVPYFLAAGSHTMIDVPGELGLETNTNWGTIKGRRVFYTAPVGVDDDLFKVILALASDAGAPLVTPSTGNVWRSFPSAGRSNLIDAVKAANTLRFGELRLSMEEVRVWDDEDAPRAIDNPAMLRQCVRENPFRSLATSSPLPRGWHVRIHQPEQLHAVVETIYPGAVADWAAQQNQTLHITSFETVITRQTGMYRALGSMSSEAQAQVVHQVCTSCVRHPMWFEVTLGDKLPCPEPCNHWLSAASENQP